MAMASASAGARSAPGLLTTPAIRRGSATLFLYTIWMLQAAAWAFLLIALLTFNPGDPPSHLVYPYNAQPLNLGGVFGAYLSYYAIALLGWGAWLALALWGVYLFVTAFVGTVGHPFVRLIGVIVMASAAASLQATLVPHSGPLGDLGGGLIGTFAADVFAQRFGVGGALILSIVTFLVGALVAVDIWVILAPLWAFRQAKAAAGPTAAVMGATAEVTAKGVGRFQKFLARLRRADRQNRGQAKAAVDLAIGKKKKTKPDPAAGIDEQAGGIGGTESFNPDEHPSEPEAGAAGRAAEAVGDDDSAEAGDGGELDGPPAFAGGSDRKSEEPATSAGGADKKWTPEELRAKIAKLPLKFAATERRSATQDDLRDIQNTQDLEGYRFPGLDQLEEPETNYPDKMEHFIREQASALHRALKEFKIEGDVVGMDSGPVITLYEVRLAPGTKVAALAAVSSDLARSLKAVNIRIVPNTAGKDTVGIEVPNPHKEKVRLKELMTKAEVFAGMKLPMFLGKDASGNPLIEDLAKMPHLLIAGTTGSGKSVCMSSILMSFLYTKKPNELKLVLVDPKMVELSQFKDIPQLMCPVVTEMSKAAAILEWAVRKMEERYELLLEAGCRDISGYNELTWEELRERFNPKDDAEAARIPKKLPYMVFVIDELADLMMTNKEVEGSIVRIAQKARAVGIHLILATQRPQANVVTGLIKSNMPARIAFKVASGMDSRIVLDQKGGELLLGQGDMLYLSPRSSKLTRAQGTLVDDKEIRRVAKFMKDVAEPTFERSLMQIRTGSEAAAGLAGDGEAAEGAAPTGPEFTHDGILKGQADELFDKAVEIVLEAQRGSVSMLQRRLAIGYTRSSRLIDAMWQAGIVGDHKGTVDREVLITPDEWAAMKALAASDAKAGGGGHAVPPDGLFAAEPKKRFIPEPAPDLSRVGEGDPFEDEPETGGRA